MEIIGLSGYARSGKDTAAQVLIEEHGFVRVAFADKLRDVLYALNPLVAPTEEGYFVNPKQPVSLQEAINMHGWDGYKQSRFGPEIRRLLQRLGTEAGRNTLWDSIWVDAAFADLKDNAKVVVTDVRFPNEFDAIRERGGAMWRIKRIGVGPVSDHPSETSLDYHSFDCIINNDNDLRSFQKKVDNAYRYSKIGES